jgi:hypothetical protein
MDTKVRLAMNTVDGGYVWVWSDPPNYAVGYGLKKSYSTKGKALEALLKLVGKVFKSVTLGTTINGGTFAIVERI